MPRLLVDITLFETYCYVYNYCVWFFPADIYALPYCVVDSRVGENLSRYKKISVITVRLLISVEVRRQYYREI